VSEKLERVEAKRFGKTNKPRKSVEDADTSPGVRGISAAVKRFVCARDGNHVAMSDLAASVARSETSWSSITTIPTD